jgi:DNA helicase-2/ATP-dependent DNA helicase PcrA
MYEHCGQDGVDFDDLLLLALRLLEMTPRSGIGTRCLPSHLVDSTRTRTACSSAWFGGCGGHGNICVVGDDQSIYGWRGADITNILEFERHFPGSTILRMEQNYRSTARILAVANAIASKNRDRKEKKLWTENATGEPVSLHLADEEEEEARIIARRIAETIRTGVAPQGIAVLYRTHAQSRPLEEALLRGRDSLQGGRWDLILPTTRRTSWPICGCS